MTVLIHNCTYLAGKEGRKRLRRNKVLEFLRSRPCAKHFPQIISLCFPQLSEDGSKALHPISLAEKLRLEEFEDDPRSLPIGRKIFGGLYATPVHPHHTALYSLIQHACLQYFDGPGTALGREVQQQLR